jgi:SAM-dependent methyltransferase
MLVDDAAEARTYHSVRFTHDPARAVVWEEISSYLQPFVAEGDGLLELGAGYGEFSRYINASPKWALDVNPDLPAYWPPATRPLIQSALDPLPLAASSVGTVFASNFFEHFTVADCRFILAEVRRVLRPGGRLIAIQPNFRLQPGRYFDDYTHISPFSDAGFADFLQALGWRIVRREGRFLPFSMKSRAPKWGWLVRLYLGLPYRPFAGQFLIVAELPEQH